MGGIWKGKGQMDDGKVGGAGLGNEMERIGQKKGGMSSGPDMIAWIRPRIWAEEELKWVGKRVVKGRDGEWRSKRWRTRGGKWRELGKASIRLRILTVHYVIGLQSGAVLGIFIWVGHSKAKQILGRPTGVVYVGIMRMTRAVWVGQVRVWIGRVAYPRFIARTASAFSV